MSHIPALNSPLQTGEAAARRRPSTRTKDRASGVIVAGSDKMGPNDPRFPGARSSVIGPGPRCSCLIREFLRLKTFQDF
jgi:hypothetical protein